MNPLFVRAERYSSVRYVKVPVLLLILMLCLTAVDYRTAEGGSKLVVIFLACSTLFLGVLLNIVQSKWNRIAVNIFVVGLLFVLVAMLSGLVRRQELFDVLAMSMPFLLFLSVLVGISSIEQNFDKKQFVSLIFFFCIASVVFKLLFAFVYYDLNFSTVRYQIISPAVVLLFSYGVASFFLRFGRYRYVALLLPVLVVLISVTRSYLVIYFFVIVFWLCCIPFRRLAFFFKKGFFLGVSLFFAFTLFLYLNDGMFERWFVRLFTGVEDHGIDVTAVTRLAEAHYQLRQLTAGVSNAVFGLGIAAETRFAAEYIEILQVVFRDDFEYVGKGFGHNNYVGLFYTGGFLFGSAFIVRIFFELFRSVMFFRRHKLLNSLDVEGTFLLAWGT